MEVKDWLTRHKRARTLEQKAQLFLDIMPEALQEIQTATDNIADDPMTGDASVSSVFGNKQTFKKMQSWIIPAQMDFMVVESKLSKVLSSKMEDKRKRDEIEYIFDTDHKPAYGELTTELIRFIGMYKQVESSFQFCPAVLDNMSTLRDTRDKLLMGMWAYNEMKKSGKGASIP